MAFEFWELFDLVNAVLSRYNLPNLSRLNPEEFIDHPLLGEF
jgi:hypothetical protein